MPEKAKVCRAYRGKSVHPPKIISLSCVLPTVRIVNVAGGGHNDTEKAVHLGDVG